MVNMGMLAVVVILLIFANFVAAAQDGRGISNYTQFNSSCNGASCNVSLDDKRGVPSGSNPLHNR
ncbi:hypothetical protein Patl1_28450 [Pistacia atlantica]|uniref:Uncharacterized protein n=1 Tax=Pistacia atlantica TaxID=434234 RepID=A0ACC1BBV0_9ROSI|nr:hypothetical protein Patl1_28450 [Pistacia atlantica]